MRFKNFIANGVMDNYPTSELLIHYNILPFTSLDSRTKSKFSYSHPYIMCFPYKAGLYAMVAFPVKTGVTVSLRELNTNSGLHTKIESYLKNASTPIAHMKEWYI